MIAATAPLLGLLGTVMGMIELFDVITMHGTSDPKLLAGGISIALVTTEAGLIAAIPLQLIHTFLVNRADAVRSRMHRERTSETPQAYAGKDEWCDFGERKHQAKCN